MSINDGKIFNCFNQVFVHTKLYITFFFFIVLSNILGEESDEENDDNEDMIPMDITEAIDPVRISLSHAVHPALDSLTNLSSSSPSTFPLFGHRTTPSNTTYQPKCARPAASSAERYRQWQILGGGFGENYDILPPEEEEFDEELKKELEEKQEFDNDLNSFLEQIVSVHAQRQLNKGKQPFFSKKSLEQLIYTNYLNYYLLQSYENIFKYKTPPF